MKKQVTQKVERATVSKMEIVQIESARTGKDQMVALVTQMLK